MDLIYNQGFIVWADVARHSIQMTSVKDQQVRRLNGDVRLLKVVWVREGGEQWLDNL